MVTSVFVSLEMGSVAAITKQDSVQISFDVSEQNVWEALCVIFSYAH